MLQSAKNCAPHSGLISPLLVSRADARIARDATVSVFPKRCFDAALPPPPDQPQLHEVAAAARARAVDHQRKDDCGLRGARLSRRGFSDANRCPTKAPGGIGNCEIGGGMGLRIGASVTRGGGWASGGANPANGTIVLQKPFVVRYFPEIANCYNGTINLQLDFPLQVRLPDIVTPPLRWHPNSDERFGITEIEFELKDKRYRAWIYTAEHSPHRFNNMVAEILTEWIDGIALDLKCAIHIRRCRQLLVI